MEDEILNDFERENDEKLTPKKVEDWVIELDNDCNKIEANVL